MRTLVCIAVLGLVTVGCGGSEGENAPGALQSAAKGENGNNRPGQAATPTFSPPPGTYDSSQLVTLSCETAGATIHYTTDGSEPSRGSTVYSGPFSVSATTTIKAVADGPRYKPSATATGTYTISPVATPTFSPPPGTYSSPQWVTLSCATDGATIFYWIEEEGVPDPPWASVYSGPIYVDRNMTIATYAIRLWDWSATARGYYIIGGASGM